MLAVNGRPVLLPLAAGPLLRPLIRHAYLAKLLWLGVGPRHGYARPRRLGDEATAGFRDAMRASSGWTAGAGVGLAFVLHPPSGLASCVDPPDTSRPCGRMPHDLQHMRALLLQEGMVVLDLEPLSTTPPSPSSPPTRPSSSAAPRPSPSTSAPRARPCSPTRSSACGTRRTGRRAPAARMS